METDKNTKLHSLVEGFLILRVIMCVIVLLFILVMGKFNL